MGDIMMASRHTSVALLAINDARHDLLQRCLAVGMRRFIRASEVGFPVMFPVRGRVLLVLHVGGLVVDLQEERALYCLMGHTCMQFCTRCTVRRLESCSVKAEVAPPRAVITTLEAQLAAYETRAQEPRASQRTPLAQVHRALPFVPVLGAMHGLSTGHLLHFRIGSFDLLHVWKLGILRLIAQRVPAFLGMVCSHVGGAVMGFMKTTLEVLNMRGFELGRLCLVSPTAPGYETFPFFACLRAG